MSAETTFFGQWLRQRRRSLDLTQTELARIIGCSVVTIRKLEIGERRASRQMAALLADKLGIADDERHAFVQFARTDLEPERFRHPLFVPPTDDIVKSIAEDFTPPDRLFPADFPGWIKVVSDEAPTLLSSRLLIARYHSAPTDSPRSEILKDGRMLCKISGTGRVVGEVNGVIRHEITEMRDRPDQSGNLAHLAVVFRIETEIGILKGACAGFMTTGGTAGSEHIGLHGKIYSVSAKFADLFLAEVDIEGEVIMAQNGIKEHGVMRIVPR